MCPKVGRVGTVIAQSLNCNLTCVVTRYNYKYVIGSKFRMPKGWRSGYIYW
jgi:hypothetical protein